MHSAVWPQHEQLKIIPIATNNGDRLPVILGDLTGVTNRVEEFGFRNVRPNTWASRQQLSMEDWCSLLPGCKFIPSYRVESVLRGKPLTLREGMPSEIADTLMKLFIAEPDRLFAMLRHSGFADDDNIVHLEEQVSDTLYDNGEYTELQRSLLLVALSRWEYLNDIEQYPMIMTFSHSLRDGLEGVNVGQVPAVPVMINAGQPLTFSIDGEVLSGRACHDVLEGGSHVLVEYGAVRFVAGVPLQDKITVPLSSVVADEPVAADSSSQSVAIDEDILNGPDYDDLTAMEKSFYFDYSPRCYQLLKHYQPYEQMKSDIDHLFSDKESLTIHSGHEDEIDRVFSVIKKELVLRARENAGLVEQYIHEHGLPESIGIGLNNFDVTREGDREMDWQVTVQYAGRFGPTFSPIYIGSNGDTDPSMTPETVFARFIETLPERKQNLIACLSNIHNAGFSEEKIKNVLSKGDVPGLAGRALEDQILFGPYGFWWDVEGHADTARSRLALLSQGRVNNPDGEGFYIYETPDHRYMATKDYPCSAIDSHEYHATMLEAVDHYFERLPVVRAKYDYAEVQGILHRLEMLSTEPLYDTVDEDQFRRNQEKSKSERETLKGLIDLEFNKIYDKFPFLAKKRSLEDYKGEILEGLITQGYAAMAVVKNNNKYRWKSTKRQATSSNFYDPEIVVAEMTEHLKNSRGFSRAKVFPFIKMQMLEPARFQKLIEDRAAGVLDIKEKSGPSGERQDTGVVKGFARKDVVSLGRRSVDEVVAAMSREQRKKLLTKDNLWPALALTDFQNEGYEVSAAWAYRQIRNALPKELKSYDTDSVRLFADTVTSLRDAVDGQKSLASLD